MPHIAKQTNTTSKKKTGTVWDRVQPVTEVDSGGLHVSLYGRSKTGKTRLISTFPKPVLIIGAEDGTRSVRNVKNVDFVYIDTSREVVELAEEAVEKGYKTVAVDTASALADLVLKEIMGLDELPAQKSWGMASREQYGQQGLQMKTLLRKVLDLPCHVVITAHERNFNEESSSDLIVPTVGSALSPSVCGWLNGAVEYICQTFIREKTVEKQVKLGNSVKTINEKVKGADYCLRIGPDPVYMTGFRLPVGADPLPEFIINPTYESIAKIIQQGG